MQTLHVIVVALAFTIAGCAHRPEAKRIDATSFETILASLEGQPEEDVAIIDALICSSADDVAAEGTELHARTLEKLRARLHGKTVREVVAEITIEQNAADQSRKRSAESFVREKRANWRERAQSEHLVQPGMAESRVVELLGEPDMRADSPATKNWLYRYDAALNDDQIWIAVVIVSVTEGIVAKVDHRGERRGLDDVAPVVK
jgi:hypothetical protein